MDNLFILKHTFGLSVTRYLWFCNYAPTWMFLLLDILFEYRVEHAIFGLLYVMFKFSTRIFYMGIPGIANDCLCWCWFPWINHLLLVCWSIFWKSSLKWKWVCKCGIMGNCFIVFNYVFTCILITQNMILYVHLPNFRVTNNALFLHSTLVLSFYIDVVKTLSISGNLNIVLVSQPMLLNVINLYWRQECALQTSIVVLISLLV